VLNKINHFVVLMLENRSFDHLLGSLKTVNPAVAGALTGEFSNPTDPVEPNSPTVSIGPADAFAMPFDPGHEFLDVQIQLYGRESGSNRAPGPRTDPAPMNGFIYSATDAAGSTSNAGRVMQCFQPEHLPVLMALAQEYAVFNYWHSSLPGPTWPNRFFVHAATSGGLADSPSDPDIIAGFNFPAGTIYERLEASRKNWYIYHDGMPQTAGIDQLRVEFLDVFTKKFRDMDHFEGDLKAGTLPEYIFIEPHYDTGHRYMKGNSMHPLNDARKGEGLVKRVYEAIRASRYWADTMLIITFDEHGAFFDHVSPPPAVPPGGDQRYANPNDHFDFDRLGVRVPAIVVSAYTRKNTVIGATQLDCVDHTSILKTIEERFGLPCLTRRDRSAPTLESALNLRTPRLSANEARMTLPTPVPDGVVAELKEFFEESLMHATAPLSMGQRVQLTLAHACNMQMLDPSLRPDAHRRFLSISGQKDAADYLQEVEERVLTRRRP
jgi:phospholipase C